MNLSSQKSAIALSASAAALLMPVSAFAEDGAAGADILIPKMDISSAPSNTCRENTE